MTFESHNNNKNVTYNTNTTTINDINANNAKE